MSAFVVAASNGVIQECKDLLDNGVSDINEKDSDGNTALLAACRQTDFELVQFLLLNGADVNLCDSK